MKELGGVALTEHDGKRAGYLIHRDGPLDVVTFAESEAGLALGPGFLFPRQREFLEALFPRPGVVSDPLRASVLYESPLFSPRYREGVALWGKGSGKDTISAVAQLYVVYRLVLHPDPQAWFSLAPDTNIDLINVAYSSEQAKTVFFEVVKSFLRRSPFFQLFLPGFDITRDVQERIIKFPKHIFAHSLHSQAEAAEGKNTFFAVMDEADAFTDASKVHNAWKIYDTLISSMKTRFPRQHLLLVLSWPRHAESFTIRKYDSSRPMRGDQPNPTYNVAVYGSRGATWEIRQDRSEADFADDYARDPEGSAAKYGTLPPATQDAFFRRPEKIEAAWTGDDLVEWEPTTTEREGRLFTGVQVLNIKPAPPGVGYWIHCDPALSSDGYALALVRADGEKRICESLMLWKPSRGRPVDYLDVERVIILLCREYRVLGVSFDQWNSAGSIQRLQAVGIYAEEITFTQPVQLAMYEAFKAKVYAGDIILPASSLVRDVLDRELKRLQLLNGRKVDHPPGESKDVADAVVAAAFRVTTEPPVAPITEQSVLSQSASTEALKVLGVGGFNNDLLKPGW